MLRLVRPTKDLKEKALDYRQAHFDFGEKVIDGSELFDKIDNYDEWLDRVTKNTDALTVDKNWTVTDTFFALDENDVVVGVIDFRHELIRFLKDYGHIGYSVRPSERKKGYATMMLSLILNYVKTLGYSWVQLAALKSNIGSIKTMTNNHAKYERTFLFEGAEADVYKIYL